MYYALNKGICLAKGDLIGLCHSDDYYYSCDVIRQLVLADNVQAADVYHGDMISVTEQGIIIGKTVSDADRIFKSHNSIVHPSTFIRKKALERLGSYNTDYRSAADYELMVKLKINNCKFYHLGILVCVMGNENKNRVSNNCYSHLETYQIHKKFNTGNHIQYLASFLSCTFRKFLKSSLHIKN
jgi:glycosyltransferase involved in cell wall biosynthesis